MDNLEVTHPTGTGSVPPFGLFAPVDCEEETGSKRHEEERKTKKEKDEIK